jgi:hypothetical protein
MGLSVPQYFNEYTSVAGYGPVHTSARWVFERNPASLCSFTVPAAYYHWYFLPTVQRHDQRAILVEAVRGGAGSVLPGQHHPPARRRGAPGQGLPLVGQVPELQDGQQERGVLLPTLQPQQVLPVHVI